MKHLKKLLVKFLVSQYSQPEEEPIDMTRQFAPEEMAELLKLELRLVIEKLAEFEAHQHHYVEEHLEPVE